MKMLFHIIMDKSMRYTLNKFSKNNSLFLLENLAVIESWYPTQ
jgi:hypothetical protein